ncbi:MAG: PrsW family intramembrane metalloprotease [Treponema sp.]|nr:PrsW family intramembrane metalloprotease [Treponema sp.]
MCFVPFVTMFALFAILVPGFSVIKGLVASLAGLLALIPITVAQFLIPGMRLFGQSSAGGILLYSIVFLGLVEECFKALLLFIVGAKEEKLSCWFCYSLLAGMIFGCFESVIYFFLNIQTIGHGVTLNLIYLRMFTAVLVHTLCAGLGGFTVYYFKNIRRNVWPLLNAVLIHGLYEYFVSFDTYVKFFCIIVILSAAIKCRVCFLQIAEEERNKKSAKRTAIDPNKTIEMPKNPAIIIPVKNTVPEDTLVSETDVIDEDAEDFDQIEREAKSQLKAAKKPAAKKAPAKKDSRAKASSKTKSAEKKAAPKTKSAASKTAKRAAPSVGKKSAAKPASKTKATAKPKTGTAKTAGKPKSASAKKTSSKPKTGAAKKSAPKAKGKK